MAYASHGVHVDAMTLQNEPLHSSDPAWTMYMDSSYQAILANKLEGVVKQQNCTLWAYDHNTDNRKYPDYVVDNTNVSNVAWHCYSGTVSTYKFVQNINHIY